MKFDVQDDESRCWIGRNAQLDVTRLLVLLITASLLGGCSQESRSIGPSQPQTPPHGANDLRAKVYDGNAYQISQGGRYFTWYGCGRCHGADETGARDLHAHGGSIEHAYRSIVEKHGNAGYGRRVPTEQLWEIAAYVREIGRIDPTKRRRQDSDQSGEPQGDSWTGPVR